ncbi:hypothetical protein B0H17DRAFT_1131429 [Mycena rosella]|uniref:Uncharacterized protein n=1 Tax=Mycena rosella TaxID=1033263 RepID=A0AAD7DNH7_MYCRO|nr:hypothetical protein B0H17DRAFT_1131429 [Mycena rosella]
MPDQGTPTPPVALAALTLETLATIAVFASAFVQQQNQRTPAPVAPVVPPFTGSGGTSEFGRLCRPVVICPICRAHPHSETLPLVPLPPVPPAQVLRGAGSFCRIIRQALGGLFDYVFPVGLHFAPHGAAPAVKMFHTIRLWDMKAGDYSAWGRPDLNLLSRFVFMHPLHQPSSNSHPTNPQYISALQRPSTP